MKEELIKTFIIKTGNGRDSAEWERFIVGENMVKIISEITAQPYPILSIIYEDDTSCEYNAFPYIVRMSKKQPFVEPMPF
jgi:hypothetical protein